ncbi:hypothetical protein RQP46_000563 [Phenoliferia psychrophenolica]
MSNVGEGKSMELRYSDETVTTYKSSDQPFLPVYRSTSRIANPSALAFMALGVTFYMVSIISLGANGLKSLGIVPAIALGYSSVALLIAGIWEFPSGQPWGAALYISLSGFYATLVLILSPWFGVADQYAGDTGELYKAISHFFFAWFITLVVFTIAAKNSSGGLLAFLFIADMKVLFLALHFYYPGHPALLTAAGSFGMVGAFVAWYAALGSLTTQESAGFRLPVLGNLQRKRGSMI